jgi:hypothetical protein
MTDEEYAAAYRDVYEDGEAAYKRMTSVPFVLVYQDHTDSDLWRYHWKIETEAAAELLLCGLEDVIDDLEECLGRDDDD